jgi:hypothetical protein
MHRAIGSARSSDFNSKGSTLTASSGGGMTFTKAAGLGKQMVSNLEEVQRRYQEMLIADRKAQRRGGYIIG